MNCRAALAMTGLNCSQRREIPVTASAAWQSIRLAAALGMSIDPHHQSVVTENCVCQHTYENKRKMPPDIKVFER
jgi:hypothetical protein